jgi:hypothetical protein
MKCVISIFIRREAKMATKLYDIHKVDGGPYNGWFAVVHVQSGRIVSSPYRHRSNAVRKFNRSFRRWNDCGWQAPTDDDSGLDEAHLYRVVVDGLTWAEAEELVKQIGGRAAVWDM